MAGVAMAVAVLSIWLLYRTAFTEPDLAARNWLCDRLADAGLDAVLDKFGNVVGSWPGVDRAVLIGSHTDTVPRGGWLDGALGVIYGLEIARACRAALPSSAIGVDVVSLQQLVVVGRPLLGANELGGIIGPVSVQVRNGNDPRIVELDPGGTVAPCYPTSSDDSDVDQEGLLES